MQINSLPLGAAFGAVKIVVSLVTMYKKQHCAHKGNFIRHNRPIQPITADYRHTKEGFGKMNRSVNRLGVVEQVR